MTTPAFVPSLEQRQVIAHRGGHLQVIACAGAGKTEAISRRVSSLIEEGVEPAQIVAFTFTERAAESLKNRITRRIADAQGQAFLDRLGPMFIGTIHASCLHMLQDGDAALEVRDLRATLSTTRAHRLRHADRIRSPRAGRCASLPAERLPNVFWLTCRACASAGLLSMNGR
jgi:superfamily I DNA/RNA helicase